MDNLMLCNYETNYFIESIVEATGRRYNIPSPDLKFDPKSDPKPDPKVEPLVGRNISEDDIAGFFRALKIGEDHLNIVRLINYYLILEFDAIALYLGHRFKDCRRIIDECIHHGLLYENYFKIKNVEKENDKHFYWYMVDTGGIYALSDRGIEYNKFPYTATLEQKYKQYLKSQFLINNYEKYTYHKATKITTKNGEGCNIVHLEDVKWSQLDKYDNTVFLVNLDILGELKINELMLDLAHKLDNNNNTFYNIAKNKFLKLGG